MPINRNKPMILGPTWLGKAADIPIFDISNSFGIRPFLEKKKKKKKKRLKMGWITNIFLKQFSVAYKILGKYKINL